MNECFFCYTCCMKKVAKIFIVVILVLGVGFFALFFLSGRTSADLCDMFTSDSGFTVENWNGVEFHLPNCWEVMENDDGLVLYNNYSRFNFEELAVLNFYLNKDLSAYEWQKMVTVDDKEYDEYQSGMNLYYVPNWVESDLVILTMDSANMYPGYEIVFGSVKIE